MKLNTKFILQQSGNILFIAALAFVIVSRLPKWIETFKKEGSKIEQPLEVRLLDGSTTLIEPKAKKVLIFWATWCGPCTLELSRIQKLVASQKVPGSRIYAIALDGDLDLVRKTANERGYTFTVAQDFKGELSRLLNVEVTPTIVFLDEDDKIQWMTTGISPTLELRLTNFSL